MSTKIQFNKSLVAAVVSTALLSACGGDDTTVEPAAVTAPVEVINEAPAEATSSVSGSVIHGKTRSAVANLNVDIHIDGQTFSVPTSESGSFYFDGLLPDAQFLVVVSDESEALATSYYTGATTNAGLVLNSISVFNAVASTVTVNDVMAENVTGLTLYVPASEFASSGMSAKNASANYMANVPDALATEANGVYTFVLPDNGMAYSVMATSYNADNGAYLVEGRSSGAVVNLSAGGAVTVDAMTESAYAEQQAADKLAAEEAAEEAQKQEDYANADYAITVGSTELIADDMFKVVVEFSHPTTLTQDVTLDHNTVASEGTVWDFGRSFTSGGIGMYPLDEDAGSVADQMTYELRIHQYKDISENDSNINNWGDRNFASKFVAYTKTNQYLRDENCAYLPGYPRGDVEVTSADSCYAGSYDNGYNWEKSGISESDNTMSPIHHTVKYTTSDTEVPCAGFGCPAEGFTVKKALNDEVTYYDDAGTLQTLPFSATPDLGYYAGLFETNISEHHAEFTASNYSWNDERTVLTITGDASMLTANVDYKFTVAAVSDYDGSIKSIAFAETAAVAAEYSLADIIFDDGNLNDRQAIIFGAINEDTDLATISRLRVPFLEANTKVNDGKVVLPGLSTKSKETYFLAGGDSQWSRFAQSTPNFTEEVLDKGDYANAYYRSGMYIVSPVQLTGTMVITGSVEKYPEVTGTYQDEYDFTRNIYGEASTENSYSGISITFGDTEVIGASAATESRVFMVNNTKKPKFKAGSLENVQAVYGEDVTKIHAGFDVMEDDGVVNYVYWLPASFENYSAASWTKGYQQSGEIMQYTADVALEINGKSFVEKGVTFNVH